MRKQIAVTTGATTSATTNKDGIGDYVHESQTLFENLLDKEPKTPDIAIQPCAAGD